MLAVLLFQETKHIMRLYVVRCRHKYGAIREDGIERDKTGPENNRPLWQQWQKGSTYDAAR